MSRRKPRARLGHPEVKAATRVMVQAVLDFVAAHAMGRSRSRTQARRRLDRALDELLAGDVELEDNLTSETVTPADTAVAEAITALRMTIALGARGAVNDAQKRAKDSSLAEIDQTLDRHVYAYRRAFAARLVKGTQKAEAEGGKSRSQLAIVREVAATLSMPVEQVLNAVRKLGK